MAAQFIAQGDQAKMEPIPRASMRMPGYDYSQPGSYFITFCTRNREEWLARVEDDQSLLTPAGEAVAAAWESLAARFSSVLLDEFMVMPNHVHAIIHLTSGEAKLGEVVRRLKAMSTAAIRAFRSEFAWQTDYYDRVVRSEYELERIRNYIISNPSMWDRDPDNLKVPEANRDRRDIWDVRNELRGHTRET